MLFFDPCVYSGILGILDSDIVCVIEKKAGNNKVEPSSLKNKAGGSVNKSNICKYLITSESINGS